MFYILISIYTNIYINLGIYKSASKQIKGIFVNGVLGRSTITISYFILRISYFG